MTDITEPVTLEVPHQIMSQMPEALRTRMSKQMQRWFGVEVSGEELRLFNFRVKIDDRTPPEWMLFFEALRAGHWDSVEIALETLRKVRPDTIKKRTVPEAKLSIPGIDLPHGP